LPIDGAKLYVSYHEMASPEEGADVKKKYPETSVSARNVPGKE